MKLFLLSVTLLLLQSVQAQYFSKVTSGSHVTDGGSSRAVNWIDYDNDGDLDLFVTNGPQGGQNNFLYRNEGNEVFTKITDSPVTLDNRSSDGSTWGDYDNDGDEDLYVTNWYGQPNLLYINNGNGTFTQITGSAVSTNNTFSEAASWGDMDNDGDLDLYVCNSDGDRRNNLYRNNGDGSFTRITTGAAVTETYFSRNADWIDINNDGKPDLFVTNEGNQHENVYYGNGDGTFTKAVLAPLTTSAGNTTSSSWEDVDNDGDFDLLIVNYNDQNNKLFLNNGNGTFTESVQGSLVSDGGDSFGSVMGDIDNDGDVDIYITNAFSSAGRVKNFLYINDGNGNFTRDTADISAVETGWSYGSAMGDYNNDGWLDLFVAKCFDNSENNSLFRNNGGANSWIKINLEGTVSNSSAIGAIVRVKTMKNGIPLWQSRRVAGSSGYCGQTLQLHFGLADAQVTDSVLVEFPSGVRQVLTQIAANQTLSITEDSTLYTDIGEARLPEGFVIYNSYPNPFNPETTIRFSLPAAGFVDLTVFNQSGELVTRLVKGMLSEGEQQIRFDATGLSSGVYYYHLVYNGFRRTGKMMYIQ
ncbi:MAG: FG-GAP-like repeat-containing protein [Ignavibacteriaceae bacterium]|nr:FG-GAP-like repeat-containing protein [Ignavibacteriaceae bacterium]